MDIDSTQAPLYEIKANLFKGLAHPARIRVLELLSASPNEPTAVRDLLEATHLEPSHLSQHLAVLRRHHIVTAERRGSVVYYQLAQPKISELLVIARTFLISTLEARQAQVGALASLPPLTSTDTSMPAVIR